MSNTFATPKVYANVGLALLVNNLVMGKLVDSEAVQKEFKPGVGTTVQVKRPPEFIIRNGPNASAQDVLEGEVTVNCNLQRGLDVAFTGFEMSANVDQLLKSKVINSAMATIASDIDSTLIDQTKYFNGWVGTPGSVMASAAALFPMPQRLDELAVPTNDRYGILTPADTYGVAGNLMTSAAQQGDVARSALEKVKIPVIGNTDWYMTQTVPTLTTGTRAATGASLINGAAQNVTFLSARTTYTQTLNIDGLTAGHTIKAGEKFTVANVNAVNPRNKQLTGFARQFTVMADATANGGGQVALTISPPIITSGAYQTVDAAPADNAAVSYVGVAATPYRMNAAFQKQAIKLIGLNPPKPFTGESDYATDPVTGLTIRYWRYSDGGTDTHNHRWDVYYGATNIDPRLGINGSGA